VLIVVALGWVAWVAYQMWPRPVATELAYRTAHEARARAAAATVPATTAPVPVPEAPATPGPASAAETSPAPEAVSLPASEPVSSPAPEPVSSPAPETFRLAQSIETPIGEPVRKPAAVKAAPKRVAAAPAAKEAAAQGERPKVERRERVRSPAERAENEFRYAAAVLKLGRATEAQAHFARALELDAHHRGARQALAAMYIERGELDRAREVLETGLRLDEGQPEQPDFAVALARILIERKDLAGALAVLDGSVAAGGSGPEFNVLRGTVLQRLGRHGEAASAYRAALERQSANPQAWVGLGISLEALHQRAEAADAFRRALAAGPLNAEVKSYAEQRVRALR
jgi:Flp pilus assembly protein TadD